MLELVSYQRAGDIALGMTRSEVHRMLGPPEDSFLKSPLSKMPTDVYGNETIHIYYRESGQVEAVEVFLPAAPEFKGHRLLGRPFREVLSLVIGLDQSAEIEDGGLTSRALGLAFYAPSSAKDPAAPVEAVMLFDRGYYD